MDVGSIEMCEVTEWGVQWRTDHELAPVPVGETLFGDCVPGDRMRLRADENVCQVTPFGNWQRVARREPIDVAWRLYGEQVCKPGDTIIDAR